MSQNVVVASFLPDLLHFFMDNHSIIFCNEFRETILAMTVFSTFFICVSLYIHNLCIYRAKLLYIHIYKT